MEQKGALFLVISSDVDHAETFRKDLENRGQTVVIADDSESAVGALSEVDVVLMDAGFWGGGDNLVDFLILIRDENESASIFLFGDAPKNTLLIKYAVAGADDYIVGSAHEDIITEVLGKHAHFIECLSDIGEMAGKGGLGSSRFSAHQISLLRQYISLGCPEVKTPGRPTESLETNVWKRLSSIREKLVMQRMLHGARHITGVSIFSKRYR